MTAMTIKQARENLPESVARHVIGWAKDNHTRKLSFQLRQIVYIAEDCTYNVFKNGEWVGLQAGGEWNGAGICNKDVNVPIGAYVIEKQHFMGKVFITVYHNNGVVQVR